MRHSRPDPLRFDLGQLVSRTVVSLYSSLVTRPTGRAVRIAIESQLAEIDTSSAISIIDLSQVSLLDFSCADEVVAKLMSRRGVAADGVSMPTAFFLLHGLSQSHRGPIEAVLERHALAIVARTDEGEVELLGTATEMEVVAWTQLQQQEVIEGAALPGSAPDLLDGLSKLTQRGLAYRDSRSGDFYALTSLASTDSASSDQVS